MSLIFSISKVSTCLRIWPLEGVEMFVWIKSTIYVLIGTRDVRKLSNPKFIDSFVFSFKLGNNTDPACFRGVVRVVPRGVWRADKLHSSTHIQPSSDRKNLNSHEKGAFFCSEEGCAAPSLKF